MQATTRGSTTSSISARAIAVVRVLVFPLPGPARTTQCPRSRAASYCSLLGLSSASACANASRLDMGRHVLDGRSDIIRLSQPRQFARELCTQPAFADIGNHRE